MQNLWLKIRIWTKVVTFGAIGVYVLVFVTRNWDSHVDNVAIPMFTTFQHPMLLTVLLVTALVSIIGWWLLRTIFRTVRQLKEMRGRSRTARLEKDLAEMKARAGVAGPVERPAAAVATEAKQA